MNTYDSEQKSFCSKNHRRGYWFSCANRAEQVSALFRGRHNYNRQENATPGRICQSGGMR